MKNLYELSGEEKSKYRKEYKKHKFAKEIDLIRGLFLVLMISAPLLAVILQGIAEDGIIIESYVISSLFSLGELSLLIFIISTIYTDVAFTRWMKIKHKIEY